MAKKRTRQSSRSSSCSARRLSEISTAIASCARCPDLCSYCAEIGRVRRKAYADWDYWAKPVAGFGDPAAWLWIVGLAPAAHGANRTGRMFTGDRSGDFLYAALHRAGLASQGESISREDGLQLSGVFISAALRCAPPGNKPTPGQLSACRPYLVQEWGALSKSVRVILALGGIAWNAVLATGRECGIAVAKPKPAFGHDATVAFGSVNLIGSYHVSQQNTFTGRLTTGMFDATLQRARALATIK
ncbi:MAG: uracil-DNA glycosylase [Planctomycetes bacterium]|nr:uracil-DNA glycosylase [Planctomycetota bacterium]NOG53230.1 uracil-DNA glycosylase [Planctomycetota bacterium]